MFVNFVYRSSFRESNNSKCRHFFVKRRFLFYKEFTQHNRWFNANPVNESPVNLLMDVFRGKSEMAFILTNRIATFSLHFSAPIDPFAICKEIKKVFFPKISSAFCHFAPVMAFRRSVTGQRWISRNCFNYRLTSHLEATIFCDFRNVIF